MIEFRYKHEALRRIVRKYLAHAGDLPALVRHCADPLTFIQMHSN